MPEDEKMALVALFPAFTAVSRGRFSEKRCKAGSGFNQIPMYTR